MKKDTSTNSLKKFIRLLEHDLMNMYNSCNDCPHTTMADILYYESCLKENISELEDELLLREYLVDYDSSRYTMSNDTNNSVNLAIWNAVSP